MQINICKQQRSPEWEIAVEGIIVMAEGRSIVSEEAPLAYKDVHQVVEVVEKAGLARRVARMRPMGVIKG